MAMDGYFVLYLFSVVHTFRPTTTTTTSGKTRMREKNYLNVEHAHTHNLFSLCFFGSLVQATKNK